MIKKIFWNLVPLLLFCVSTQAQHTPIFFNQNSNDGVPGNWITDIAQDGLGYIWVGTDNGLALNNGHGWVPFRHDPQHPTTLLDSEIRCVKAGTGDQVWVGTRSGLNLFDRKTHQFFHAKNQESGYLMACTTQVEDISVDNHNNLWIVGEGRLLTQIDEANDTAYFFRSPKVNSGLDFFLSTCVHGSNVWIGTQEGVLRFDRETKTFDIPHPKMKRLTQVRAIQATSRYLLIGAQGLHVYDLVENEFIDIQVDILSSLGTTFDAQPIHDIEVTDSDIVYAASDGVGLLALNLDKMRLTSLNDVSYSNISTRDGWSILKDRWGQLWYGNFHKGVDISTEKSSMLGLIRSDKDLKGLLPSGNVHGITLSPQDQLIVSVDGGGLSTADSLSGQFTTYRQESGLATLKVLGSTPLDSSTYWLATYGGGAYRFNSEEKTMVSIDELYPELAGNNLLDFPRIVYEIGGKIYFGTIGHGVSILDKETKELLTFQDFDGRCTDWVESFVYDGNRTIWIGGPARLFKLDTQTNEITEILTWNELGLNHALLRSIVPDGDVIWVGTSKGLVKYSPGQKKIELFDGEKGLPYTNIFSMGLDPNGEIWLATTSGLVRWNHETRMAKTISPKEGLPTTRFAKGNIHITQKGKLLFPTADGILILNTKSIQFDSHLPPHYLSKITTKDTVHLGFYFYDSLGRQQTLPLELHPGENEISFEVDALTFNLKESCGYQFQLEGYDKEWRPVTANNFITYTNLKPKEYTLLYRVSSPDDEWSEPKSFTFKIRPTFFQGILFKILFALTILLLGLILVRMRIRATQRKSRLLEERVRSRTLELEVRNQEVKDINKALETQNGVILEQKNQIESSIVVGSLVQGSALPNQQRFKKYFKEHFLLYLPRDIVSGDFYYLDRQNGKVYLACADCTGHGVAGAMLTMVGMNLLQSTISAHPEISAGQLLTKIHLGMVTTLTRDGRKNWGDGMDIALAVFDFDKQSLNYAGAKSKIFHMPKAGGFNILEVNRLSIGLQKKREPEPYNDYHLELIPGDRFYFFTDGLGDQLGLREDDEYHRLNTKRIKETLRTYKDFPLENQKEEFLKLFQQWKGDTEQTDDILGMAVTV